MNRPSELTDDSRIFSASALTASERLTKSATETGEAQIFLKLRARWVAFGDAGRACQPPRRRSPSRFSLRLGFGDQDHLQAELQWRANDLAKRNKMGDAE